MPYSYAQYAGNGALTSFSVPFPYLLRAHVKVFIGYNLLTGGFTSELVDGTGFTWTSATQIQATTAPTSGQTLTIIRQTPSTALVVGWNDGSNLIANDLNTADLQNLYVVQESLDRSAVVAAAQTQASADAAAALAGVANTLPYGPVGTVAAIPISAANGTRVEVANSTGIESFSPLTGRPAGFTGSSQIKVRLVYATAGATWQWVDYAVADPDGRYVLQSSISSSTTSTSTASVANSLAVKTATDAAAAAQTTANTAVTNAAAAQTTANTAVTNAAAAQTTANTAVTNAAAAQTTANTAQATASSAFPVGAIFWFAASTAPTGFLKANGAAISRTTYAALFAAIGTTFGAGDGTTTFALPDLRGEFIRGLDDGRGVDSGRAFGSAQADELRSHTHTMYPTAAIASRSEGGNGSSIFSNPYTGTTGATGGAETRPRNIALLACIKY